MFGGFGLPLMAFRGESGARRLEPGRSPAPNRPGKWQFSVGQHVLVIRHRVRVVTGFVRIGPWSGRSGQAGWWVLPGTEVAKDLLDQARVLNDGDDAHGVLAHWTAQWVNKPDSRNQVAGGGMGMRCGAVCNTHEIRPHDSAFCMLPSDFPPWWCACVRPARLEHQRRIGGAPCRGDTSMSQSTV